MKKLIRFIKYLFRTRKVKDDKPSFNVETLNIKSGIEKGADIWGEDWPIPVAEKLEWTFAIDIFSEKQYIVTALTDYILWFIPFKYDLYIYEVPKNTYNMDTITAKDAVNAIAICEKWNYHDNLYYETKYNAVGILHMKDRFIYPLGSNDWLFIRTKEA